jgi:hypothetical protein
MKFIEIGPERSEIEECEYIPFICNRTITYPTPVKVGNWVSNDLGTCITCAQKLFTPIIPT